MSNQLAEALRWALAWIDAVPTNTQLPVMPGFDRDFVEGLLAAHEAAKPAEPVLYRFTTYGQSEWQVVEPRNPHVDTVQDRVRELLTYRYQGKPCYEVQALYAAPVAVASPWLPIETAPKDGTTVLTFRLLNGEPQICDARYFALGDAWGQRSWRYPSETGPAHWMPLPPAPEMKP